MPSNNTDIDPDRLLTRIEAAVALAAHGYPVAPSTLSTKAVRGGGPSYRVFAGRAVYRWGDLVTWAQAQARAPRRGHREAAAPQRAA